jgi:hypothetical protein
MAQPAMAMAAGSTASRASDLPNDHPAILIAVPSPGSTIAAPRTKKPYGRFPYGFCHDRRCTDPVARQQSPSAEMVSCHLDNIAAAGHGLRDRIADARQLDWRRRITRRL